MSPQVETLIVATGILVAAGILVSRAWRGWRSNCSGGCGSCGGPCPNGGPPSGPRSEDAESR